MGRYTAKVSTKTRVSLEEFLAMPETKPYKEFVDGEVVEKPMPVPAHGQLVVDLITETNLYVREHPEFRVETEVRHADLDNAWVFLPDISLTRKTRRPPAVDEPRGPVEVMPDFAIEVLSPDDRPGRVAQRVNYYLRAGVTLVWIVDPEDESVTVFERGAESRVVTSPDELTGEPVLPGFTLDLGRLFATLHQ